LIRAAFWNPVKWVTQTLLEGKRLTSKPNDRFAYSNLGYVILGQLIEQISGKSYENYIRDHILSKLPLEEDNLSFTIPDSGRHARGYHKKWTLTNLVLGFLLDKSMFMDQTVGNWKSFKYYYVNGSSYGGLIGKPGCVCPGLPDN
jgi:CubicO group peptidase (beta-lactamase class C family)